MARRYRPSRSRPLYARSIDAIEEAEELERQALLRPDDVLASGLLDLLSLSDPSTWRRIHLLATAESRRRDLLSLLAPAPQDRLRDLIAHVFALFPVPDLRTLRAHLLCSPAALRDRLAAVLSGSGDALGPRFQRVGTRLKLVHPEPLPHPFAPHAYDDLRGAVRSFLRMPPPAPPAEPAPKQLTA